MIRAKAVPTFVIDPRIHTVDSLLDIPWCSMYAFDTETYADPTNPLLVDGWVRRWISMGKKHHANDLPFCISISDGKAAWVCYTLDGAKEFFSQADVQWVAHNATFDRHMLANIGVSIVGRVHDTLYLSKLFRPTALSHKLRDQDGVNTLYEDILAADKKDDYRQYDRQLMTMYTGTDVLNCMHVFNSLYQDSRLYDLECEVGHVAYTIERCGMYVDKTYQKPLTEELTAECVAAENRCYTLAGRMFNINSGQQLAAILTEQGYTVKLKAETGNPVMDKYALDKLSTSGCELATEVLHYKAALKMLETYAKNLYFFAQRHEDGSYRVHPSINTMEAKTGRFSISSPSMQNMPRRGDLRVRKAFIAPAGHTLYDFDFKSQEAVILAHYSRAAQLVQMANDGVDIHKATAAIVYSKPADAVTKEERTVAKTVGFAITYGAGADKIAAMLGISVAEATSIKQRYLNRLPEIRRFISACQTVMKSRGHIKTVLGRPVACEPGREYTGVNYVIQGSAADSTKRKLVAVYKWLRASGYKSKICLQIHDSLNGLIADGEDIAAMWKAIQAEAAGDLFSIGVDVDVARCNGTWADKEELDMPAAPVVQVEYDIWKEGTLC